MSIEFYKSENIVYRTTRFTKDDFKIAINLEASRIKFG